MAELEELSRQQARNARQLYESSQYESMRRPWQSHAHICVGKQDFSKNLAPLRRWLFSKVGQHWDDIYSELCQRIDKRTTTGQRFFSHLWDCVEPDFGLIDGAIVSRYYSNVSRHPFYIHPDTGILCAVKKPPREPAKKSDDCIVIDNYHEYRKLSDVWYLVTFENIPQGVAVRDVISGQTVQLASWQRERIYAASKRQCSKKEIKHIMKQLNQ